MAQVGWLGFSGEVYAVDDPPRDHREKAGYQPLYIQIGIWEHLGDGEFELEDGETVGDGRDKIIEEYLATRRISTPCANSKL